MEFCIGVTKDNTPEGGDNVLEQYVHMDTVQSACQVDLRDMNIVDIVDTIGGVGTAVPVRGLAAGQSAAATIICKYHHIHI